MLVQAQGEMLDNIQLNVEEAENYVKKANKQLKKAKESHKKWKKVTSFCLKYLTFLLVEMHSPPLLDDCYCYRYYCSYCCNKINHYFFYHIM